MTLRAGALGLVAALALAVPVHAETLPKKTFIKQADKICADADRKLSKLPAPQSAKQVNAYFKKAKPIFTAQVAKLEALTPQAPSSIAATYAHAMDILDQQVALIDDLIAAGSDQTKLDSVTRKLDKLDGKGNRLAKKLGLTKCGSG